MIPRPAKSASLGALLCAVAAAVGGGLPAAAGPPGCIPVHAGIDTTFGTTSRGTIYGSAIGQSFLAQDTLVSQLTVWRPANRPNVLGVHLYITGVDTTLTPPRPNTHDILLDGPTLHVYDSDPPGWLVELPFVFDPPLVLPHPGLYAFFLQTENCHQGEFDIVASDQNPYPYGIYWVTGDVTHPPPCYLRSVAGGGDFDDLIFDIEFCRPDPATPTHKSTWGEVKVKYR